jgi:nucleotidyltransferase substrate binding protein (TIGR01987 family)
MTMPLDLTPLANATARLHEGLARYQSDPTDTQIRDGLIQRFEFTYELSHKMLRRQLEQAAANPEEFDGADFQYLIRSGNEQGLLLSAWPVWRGFRELRGKTSHTYDEAIALEVVARIPAFLAEAEHLLQRLKERQAGG